MATTPATIETVLRVRRTLAASRKEVYRAWTQPEALTQWMAPTDEYEVSVPELDLRVGGRYRLEMHHSGGAVHKLQGTYRVLQPYEKLAFTWAWEGDPAMVETLVTVELTGQGQATDMLLTHDFFPDVAARDKHVEGWGGCLGRLERYFERTARK